MKAGRDVIEVYKVTKGLSRVGTDMLLTSRSLLPTAHQYPAAAFAAGSGGAGRGQVLSGVIEAKCW